ncbi:uncharacterized protein LOC132607818 [Lycium barbarum]|uniref:uncharacterized protein LOC132607818 n=1 Tax=Lycium barbarum TaxID=112863 RepID=UPI00293F698D|nr:uncharacterized protein LOC132607818 [Lycium barbarum]
MGGGNFSQLVTKKVMADFIKNNLICRFGVLESIITDNGANLNSHFMKDICERFKITHKNSTAYRPQMNGAVEATNKNIKKILTKMIDNYKNWHEQLPYSLLGSGDPFTQDHQEAELNDAEWVKNRYEQLAMIDEKRMVEVGTDSCTNKECHDPSTVGSEPDSCKSVNSYSSESSLIKKNTRESLHQTGKNHTWSGKTAGTSSTRLTHSKSQKQTQLGGEVPEGHSREWAIKTNLTMRVTKRMNNKGTADQKDHEKNE